MAESIIFMEGAVSEIIENYRNVISGGEIEKIPNEEVYKYEDVYIYPISEKWVAIETETGEVYDPDILLRIAKEKKCIYTYVNEDLLEGELVVIEEGVIIKKVLDYYSTPELNENSGKIEYEEKQEINDWIAIGEYMDYLYNAL